LLNARQKSIINLKICISRHRREQGVLHSLIKSEQDLACRVMAEVREFPEIRAGLRQSQGITCGVPRLRAVLVVKTKLSGI
jgi:hypothetical protein